MSPQLDSLCISGTEGCTVGCCSGAGLLIGVFWVSYSSTGGTYACSSGSGELSLVVRPLYDGEINKDNGSCFS